MLKNGINAMAKALSEYHEEMQQNIDQATSDLRETLEQIEIQNVELDMAKKRARRRPGSSPSSSPTCPTSCAPLSTGHRLHPPTAQDQPDPEPDRLHADHREVGAQPPGIINDILDFSKLEAGKLQLEHIPFSLRDTLNETMHLLGPSAHDKQL